MKALRILTLGAVMALLLSGPALAAIDFEFDAPERGAVTELNILTRFETTVTNTGDQAETFFIDMVKDLPDTWTGSLCIGETCFPPWIVHLEIDLAPSEVAHLDIDILAQTETGSGRSFITVSSSHEPSLTQSHSFQVVSTGIEVLLVNGHPEGSGYPDYYADALDGLATAHSWAHWYRPESGELSGLELENFDVVVWETDDTTPGLDYDDMTALSYYVMHDGSLLLSGQNLAYASCDAGSPDYDATNHTWFQAILGSDYVANDAGTSNVDGLDGDPVGDGFSFAINGGTGSNSNTSPDVLSAVGAGSVSLQYDVGGGSAVASTFGTGSSYFMGFGFEGIDTDADRQDLMQAIFNWFEGASPAGELLQPLLVRAPFATPNPFNPQTSIKYEVGGDQAVAVEVAVFDLKGRRVRELFNGSVNPGPQSLLWNGRDDNGHNLATGVYLARVKVADENRTVKMTLAK